MRTKKSLIVSLLIFLVITLSFAQQPPPPTTNAPQNGTDQGANTTTPPPPSTEALRNDTNTSGSEPEPKVFIIHHHYRDPGDFDFSRRLLPVDSGASQDSQVDGGDDGSLPAEYSDPNYPYGPQPQPPAAQEEPEGRFDPLGDFTDTQKKRQFFQDLLMNQLAKFEAEFEPMIEREDNMTEKNDMEEVLMAVKDLKQTLENHQIFNITQLMEDWKEGRLKPSSNDSKNEKPPPPMPKVQHHYHYRQPPPPSPPLPPPQPSPQQRAPPRSNPQRSPSSHRSSSSSSASRRQPLPPPAYHSRQPPINLGPAQSELTLLRPPPVTRTFLLVPQSRIIQPEFAPHFDPQAYPPQFTAPRVQSNLYSEPTASASRSMYNPMQPMIPPMYRRRPQSSLSSASSMYYNPNGNSYGELLGRSVSGGDVILPPTSATATTTNDDEDDDSAPVATVEPKPKEEDETNANNNNENTAEDNGAGGGGGDGDDDQASPSSSSGATAASTSSLVHNDGMEYQK